MRSISYLVCLLLVCIFEPTSSPSACAQELPRHANTNWRLRPSLKYDTLCLLNVLSGDPYYLKYYQAEFDHFHPLFTPGEQASFVEMKHILKDKGKGIVSARLTLYYSSVNDETLPQMIRTAHDSSAMKSFLRKTPYWNAEEWQIYDEARPVLEVALTALERVGFPAYWTAEIRPRIEQRIAELSGDLPRYNIIPKIEGLLGYALQSDTITVYLLAYSEPHGIRITGLQFLTHLSYPFAIVLHNAIHESMHPPFRISNPAVREALASLGREPLVVDKVQHHDPSFGYNTAAGYIEEDSVQALEQIVSEQFGVAHNACAYWQQQDGGMHALAAAIYAEYGRALTTAPESYSEWLVRAVRNGELRGDNLRKSSEAVLASPHCK